MKKTYQFIFYFLFLQIIFSFFYSNIYASSKEFLDISSPSAVVIDFDSGRILYNKNATEQRKMASLTKVMTSILLVENCDLDEEIEVPKEVAWIGGSTVGLKPR
ncbi:MAG: hypothetical protein Q4D02_03080 [Clostridia bacterium]|nr:hypothetical protein [Clostridia bacterium]